MNTQIVSRLDELAKAGRVRILAYGSSNTSRRIPGMHWLDCVQLGFCRKYGPVGHFINTGIGGNTSRDLLQRFDSDAAQHTPHITFLTIGGNDSRTMSEDEFEANLHSLHQRFEKIGTHVIFQTYYAPDSTTEEPHTSFYNLSECVRRVAAATNSSLIDNLSRWLPIREQHYDAYQDLMMDAFHLTERGNKVYGFDIARSIGCPVEPVEPVEPFWTEAIHFQKLMDALGNAKASD